MDNANSPEYLEKIRIQVIENLKRTTFAPSVQMTDVPRDPEGMDDEADALLDDLDEDDNKDTRYTKRRWDKYVEKDGELSDSEDEDENEANGVRRQPQVHKRRNMMDYQNAHALPDDKEPESAIGTPERSGSHERDAITVAHPKLGPAGSDQSASGHSSPAALNGSGGSNPDSRDSSIHPGDVTMEDVDADVADEPVQLPVAQAQLTTDRPQEATPPDSPPTVAAAPTLPAQAADEIGNDAMDEGDTSEDPEVAKEAGLHEREQEDVAAEKATEIAERSEQI